MHKWSQLLQKSIPLACWDNIWTSKSKSSRCVVHRETTVKILMFMYRTPWSAPLLWFFYFSTMLVLWHWHWVSYPYFLAMLPNTTFLGYGKVYSPKLAESIITIRSIALSTMSSLSWVKKVSKTVYLLYPTALTLPDQNVMPQAKSHMWHSEP